MNRHRFRQLVIWANATVFHSPTTILFNNLHQLGNAVIVSLEPKCTYVFDDFVDGNVVWEFAAFNALNGTFGANICTKFEQMIHNAGAVRVVLKRGDAHRRLAIPVLTLWVSSVCDQRVVSSRQKYLRLRKIDDAKRCDTRTYVCHRCVAAFGRVVQRSVAVGVPSINVTVWRLRNHQVRERDGF